MIYRENEKQLHEYVSLAQIQWNQSTVCCSYVIILFEIQIFSSISCLNQCKVKQRKENYNWIFCVHFTFLNLNCAQFFFHRAVCWVFVFATWFIFIIGKMKRNAICATKRRRKKKSKNKLEWNIYKIFRWCWCHGLIQMYLHPTITLTFFFRLLIIFCARELFIHSFYFFLCPFIFDEI